MDRTEQTGLAIGFEYRPEHRLTRHVFRGPPQSLHMNAAIVPHLGPRPYKSTSRNPAAGPLRGRGGGGGGGGGG
jgi:hypothetical protein